jgi:hypothetical protein
MQLDSFQLCLLVGGSAFFIFGTLVVFSDKFRESWWNKEHETELDKKIFPGRSGYYFDRYGRGLGGLTLGVMMLATFVGSLWKPLLPFLIFVETPLEWLPGKKWLLALFSIVALYFLFRHSLHHSRADRHDTKPR